MTMTRKPMTRQRSPWELDATTTHPWPCSWHHRRVGDGTLVACVADEPRIGWHMSISFRNHRGDLTRYPTWDEIAHARDELLPADVEFAMLLPRAGEYVALHDTTFHLHQHPANHDRDRPRRPRARDAIPQTDLHRHRRLVVPDTR